MGICKYACSYSEKRIDTDQLGFRTPKKDILLITGVWKAKLGSQETPGVTGKFGLQVQNEVGQRLTEFCQENALVIANTLFQKHEKTLHMDITRWSILKSDQLYSLLPKMEKLYTVSENKTRSRLWLRSWIPYCQIQTKIEERREGKTTISLRYDLNQIHYNYTVEVTNRSKGLDLIDRVPMKYGRRFMTL